MEIQGMSAVNRTTRRSTTGTAASAGFQELLSAVPKQGRIVYLKTDDMLFSGGNGTGLSYYLKYAEQSTPENPIIVAKGVDEHGQDFEQRIEPNRIDPTRATVVELRALEAHYKKGSVGMETLPMLGGDMGLHDRADFTALLRKAIHDAKTLSRPDLAACYLESLSFLERFK